MKSAFPSTKVTATIIATAQAPFLSAWMIIYTASYQIGITPSILLTKITTKYKLHKFRSTRNFSSKRDKHFDCFTYIKCFMAYFIAIGRNEKII